MPKIPSDESLQEWKKREDGNTININIEWQRVAILQVQKQINQFCYLGTLISDDGTCAAEIKSIAEMAKNAFKNRSKLFSNIEKRIKEEGYYNNSLERHVLY